MSQDEKREKMLRVFHDKLEVFNIKEIEKFSIKAGISILSSAADF